MQDVSKLGLKINPHILCSLSCIFFYLEQFSSCILRMRICHTCPSVKVQLSLIGLAVLTSTTINTGSLFLQFNPVCYSIFALLYGYLQLLAFSIIFSQPPATLSEQHLAVTIYISNHVYRGYSRLQIHQTATVCFSSPTIIHFHHTH